MLRPNISNLHVKAARALLGWSQEDLAHHSGTSIATIKRREAQTGELQGRESTKQAIVAALKNAGIEFIEQNGRISTIKLQDKEHYFFEPSASNFTWMPDILNANIAPEFSNFSNAKIPDLSESANKARFWMADHILNRILRAKWPKDYAHLVFNFIYRAQNCLLSYEEARMNTETYLARLNEDYPNVSRYYLALSAWEAFTLQFAILVRITNEFPNNEKVFDSNGNSPEKHLYEIANDIKHAIEAGQRTPIWLSNSGVHSSRAHAVTYNEVADMLSELPENVDLLIDPASVKEKLKKRMRLYLNNNLKREVARIQSPRKKYLCSTLKFPERVGAGNSSPSALICAKATVSWLSVNPHRIAIASASRLSFIFQKQGVTFQL